MDCGSGLGRLAPSRPCRRRSAECRKLRHPGRRGSKRQSRDPRIRIAEGTLLASETIMEASRLLGCYGSSSSRALKVGAPDRTLSSCGPYARVGVAGKRRAGASPSAHDDHAALKDEQSTSKRAMAECRPYAPRPFEATFRPAALPPPGTTTSCLILPFLKAVRNLL